MLDTPEVIRTEPIRTATIHLCVPWAKMREVMGPGLAELHAALAAQGATSLGPWFNHHFRMPTDSFDFEICLPVDKQISPVGRVKPGELRGAVVARAIHRGPYDGLGEAWGGLKAWIAAQGHVTASDFWERYLVGPEANPDPKSWSTELNWPLTSTKGG